MRRTPFVDSDHVGEFVFDDRAVHERPEVAQRLVEQVGGGDALAGGLGELARHYASRSRGLKHYGRGTPIATVLAHIAYGAIAGGFASIAG